MTKPFRAPTQGTKIASTERVYHVSHADLPLSCPMPGMRLWDAHPKVYLPIEETGQATCPYCAAEFLLTAA
jgi:uncharacterized Zn-finger protein